MLIQVEELLGRIKFPDPQLLGPGITGVFALLELVAQLAQLCRQILALRPHRLVAGVANRTYTPFIKSYVSC